MHNQTKVAEVLQWPSGLRCILLSTECLVCLLTCTNSLSCGLWLWISSLCWAFSQTLFQEIKILYIWQQSFPCRKPNISSRTMVRYQAPVLVWIKITSEQQVFFLSLNSPSPPSPLKSWTLNSKVNWWVGLEDIGKGQGAGTWHI